MARIILIVIGIQLLLIQGCEKKQSDEMSTLNQANIYLKGVPLQLNDDAIFSIIKQTDNALAEGKYQKPYGVTTDLINKIKDNEKYLEISFKENRFVMTDNYGKIEYKQVMIPLTGQFALPESFILFFGTSGYNSTPMICNHGYKELKELLIGLE